MNSNFRLIFLLIILIFLGLFSTLPYFNIVINTGNMILALLIFVILSFKLPSEIIFFVSLILLLISILLLLISQNLSAEQLGNDVFFLLLLGFIQRFYAHIKK